MEHEVRTDTPNWQTKIICTCGEQSASYMSFYRHRGDAYKELYEEIKWMYDGLCK